MAADRWYPMSTGWFASTPLAFEQDAGGILRWEDPPPQRRPPSRHNWALIAEKLRTNPKRWAVISEGSRAADAALTRQIKSAMIMAFRPAGHFDACSRSTDGKTVTYARYVGPSDDGAS